MMAKEKNSTLYNTGERMIPEFHKGELLYAEHVNRYESALPIVQGKVVLDIASGSGYGTKILASEAKHVYGVDVSAEAVGYAKEHFAAKNVEFKVGDGRDIPLEDNSVDVVVTFETIEHIEDFEHFLDEVKRVLRPDGTAIISTPNDKEFAEGNHFHVHEFQYDELMKVIKKRFKYNDPYFQATWKYVAIGRQEFLEKTGPIDVPIVSYAPLKQDQYLYFYIVCSDKAIKTEIKPLAALGGHYSDRTILGDTDEAARKLKDQKAHADYALEHANGHIEYLKDQLKAIEASRGHRIASKLTKVHSKLKRSR